MAVGQIRGYVLYVSYDIDNDGVVDSKEGTFKNIVSLADLYTECVNVAPGDNVTNFTIILPQDGVNNAVYFNLYYDECNIISPIS